MTDQSQRPHMVSDDVDDALAEAYNEALRLEKAGKLDEAAQSYQRALALDSEDYGGVSVRLASIKKGPVPDRAPPAYICTLFNQHADMFDKILVDDLGYHVPTLAAKMLNEHITTPLETMLDLGCGTGLMALAILDHLDKPPQLITGIDLAENMLDIAYEHDIYETLYVDDVEHFLSDNFDEKWDLITAMDLLPYLGDLTIFIKGLTDHLNLGGYAIFSTETLPDEAFDKTGFTIGEYQRFAHRLDYIEAELAKHNLELIKANKITVRHEQGLPIDGHLVLVKKSNT